MDQKEVERLITELIFATRLEAPRSGSFLEAGLDLQRMKNWALEEVLRIFEFKRSSSDRDLREVKLRIALHLSPPDAIDYDPANLKSRKSLIRRFLQDEHKFEASSAEGLARHIASLLDDWDADRDHALSKYRDHLVLRQDSKCALCKLKFGDEERIRKEEEAGLSDLADPYKPYFDGDGVHPYMDPVVDHLKAISVDGSNRIENLQALCGLCNSGKGDGLGVRVSDELGRAAMPVAKVPRFHRMRLLYYRLQMDDGICTLCGNSSNELTVRPKVSSGPFCLTNLRSVCRGCAGLV